VKVAGGGGDTRHPAQQVERRALAAEQHPRRAGDHRQGRAGLNVIAVAVPKFHGDRGIEGGEHGKRHVETGQPAFAPSDYPGARPGIGGNDAVGGDIARRAEILFQRARDDRRVTKRIERRHLRHGRSPPVFLRVP